MMLFFGLIAAVTLVAALLSQPSHRLAVSAAQRRDVAPN
jgi:nitrogen fixation protein FixH